MARRSARRFPKRSLAVARAACGLQVTSRLRNCGTRRRRISTRCGSRCIVAPIPSTSSTSALVFARSKCATGRGGFNRDLDGEFSLYDPQQRRVLHPWDTFSGVDTKHYASYDDFAKRLHGANIVMPTEILHGLYDGGMGAGLDDYWRALTTSPV